MQPLSIIQWPPKSKQRNKKIRGRERINHHIQCQIFEWTFLIKNHQASSFLLTKYLLIKVTGKHNCTQYWYSYVSLRLWVTFSHESHFITISHKFFKELNVCNSNQRYAMFSYALLSLIKDHMVFYRQTDLPIMLSIYSHDTTNWLKETVSVWLRCEIWCDRMWERPISVDRVFQISLGF